MLGIRSLDFKSRLSHKLTALIALTFFITSSSIIGSLAAHAATTTNTSLAPAARSPLLLTIV